ncbi:hypothetical protein GCM10025869_10880 [Homoserinibacter gongjuensis]|uniref:SGNH hydrolase-type esterase domain-containing protein n=1 Tax=Homoserinibacter gongjuensis TaxID=1162968 RepID=A0ABQ6JTY8_9MICO|nr:hypothetical protein GCM10025869_10880 [Homoserinibacter gongjuensis]
MPSIRYVAIGDSFTEGVGDELPDGRVRGWADLVAEGWAAGTGEPIDFANLAIRGKLIGPIVEEQLEPALALKPTHLSFNGGGNDILRPKADVDRIVGLFGHVLRRCDEEGVRLILLSGADPTRQLPLGRVMKRRGTCSRAWWSSVSPIGPTSSAPTTGSMRSSRRRASGPRIACT